MQGSPVVFLPMLHYALLLYSPQVATFIRDKGYELRETTGDKGLVSETYKFLLNTFSYRPKLTTVQFFQNGFAERKIILMTDIIQMVKQKNMMLNKGLSYPKPAKHQPDVKIVRHDPPAQ